MARVLVTRAAEDAAALSIPLQQAGLQPVLAPLLRREPIPGALVPYWEEEFDLALLTSAAAVDPFAGAVFMEMPCPERIYAVGPATKRAAEVRGLELELLPAGWTARDAINMMGVLFDKTVLWPSAEQPTPSTRELLDERGAVVTQVAVYRNVEPEGAHERLVSALPVDVIPFLSGSAARRFADHGLDPGSARIVAIGPTTAAVCEEVGLPVHHVCEQHDVDGVVAGILEVLGR